MTVVPFVTASQTNRKPDCGKVPPLCLVLGTTALIASLLIHPVNALALGVGIPVRQPVVGGLLRIEIPLILGVGEPPPRSECLRIAPVSGSNDRQFFPYDARLFVEMRGSPRILIISQRLVQEPIVEFTLHVGCNGELSREVLLLSEPPRPSTVLSIPEPQAATAQQASPVEFSAPKLLLRPSSQPGTAVNLDNQGLSLPTDTTLNAMARKWYPTQRTTRDEYRKQMIAANPELFLDAAHPGAVLLPKGTVLKVPDRLPPIENPLAKPSADLAFATRSPGQVVTPGALSHRAKDRLVIGGGIANDRKFLASGEARDAIDRLERMIAEQRQIESRIEESLLLANQSLLNAQRRFSDLHAAQELDAKGQKELRSRLDKVDTRLDGVLGFWELLILILTSGSIGAGLLILYARLASARIITSAKVISPDTPPTPVEAVPPPSSPPTEAHVRTTVISASSLSSPSTAVGRASPAPSESVSIPPTPAPSTTPVDGTTTLVTHALESVTAAVTPPSTSPSKPSPQPVHTLDTGLPTINLPPIEITPPDFVGLPLEKKTQGLTAVSAEAPITLRPANAPSLVSDAMQLSPSNLSEVVPAPSLPESDKPMFEMSPPEIMQSSSATDRDTRLSVQPTANSTQALKATPDADHLSLITPEVMLSPELAAKELKNTPHATKLISGKATIAVAQSIGLTGDLATQINQLLPRLPSFDINAWFEALDILHSAGERKAFATLGKLLSETLNVEPPFWNRDSRAEKASVLDYPNLMRKLQALWNSEEPELARALLVELIADSRNGTRNGFPEGAAKEIQLLIRILDEHSLKH
jgi:hypothetical protein